ncbi:MAG: nucleotidyl transferase AbiEii/AbiGii toxin family protein [Coriobacteriales bacterium]|nr:nucleotidyl transferase AbiEii/AbiGii toxin family protein [Coriobacteriales bacterium]
MIRSSMQLKDKVRNLSHGDGMKSQTLIRTFVMERFLERVSISPYRDNFVLKGGMLVASIVGLDTRSTMDVDATVRSLSLTAIEAKRIVGEIVALPLDDGVTFTVMRIDSIMEEHDYPGVRLTLAAKMDKLRQTIKIDISTGDALTPSAVMRDYGLMLEDRSIALWTYNLETLLAEKLETIMVRAVTNTRMRDFYDIHVLTELESFDSDVFRSAFIATSVSRSTTAMIANLDGILSCVEDDEVMRKRWRNYARKTPYVNGLSWEDAMRSVRKLGRLVSTANDAEQHEDRRDKATQCDHGCVQAVR